MSDELIETLLDIRNGVAGSRFTTRSERKARKMKLAKYSGKFGEIKLTRLGWDTIYIWETISS